MTPAVLSAIVRVLRSAGLSSELLRRTRGSEDVTVFHLMDICHESLRLPNAGQSVADGESADDKGVAAKPGRSLPEEMTAMKRILIETGLMDGFLRKIGRGGEITILDIRDMCWDVIKSDASSRPDHLKRSFNEWVDSCVMDQHPARSVEAAIRNERVDEDEGMERNEVDENDLEDEANNSGNYDERGSRRRSRSRSRSPFPVVDRTAAVSGSQFPPAASPANLHTNEYRLQDGTGRGIQDDEESPSMGRSASRGVRQRVIPSSSPPPRRPVPTSSSNGGDSQSGLASDEDEEDEDLESESDSSTSEESSSSSSSSILSSSASSSNRRAPLGRISRAVSLAGGKFRCPACGNIYGSRYSCDRHHDGKHGDRSRRTRFRCPIPHCGYRTYRSDYLNSHFRHNHE